MKKHKVIQVPMPSDFLAELDAAARDRGESRAAFIREAVADYIASANEAALVKQYIEGYEKFPETDEEREWADAAWSVTAERWAAEEDWSEEYAEFVKAEEAAKGEREKR
jgi:metal-responsive CopG/Arc/MetJ family transcriptional regulator